MVRQHIGMVMAILLLLTGVVTHAGQRELPDSILQLLKRQPDTAKISLLLRTAEKHKYTHPSLSRDLSGHALLLAKKGKNSSLAAEANLSLARAYITMADYQNALQCCYNALTGFTESKNWCQLAKVNHIMGRIYLQISDDQNAVIHFQRALDLFKRVQDIRASAEVFSDIGKLYIQQDSIDMGLSHLLVAYLIADSIGNQTEIINLLNHIGNGFLKLGNFIDSRSTFKEALALARQVNNPFLLSQVELNLANVSLKSGDYAKAQNYARRSRQIASERGYTLILRDTELVLSDAFASTGDYRRALQFHQSYKNLSDSILNEERFKQLTEIKALYDLKNMEKENVLLVLRDEKAQARIKQRTLIMFFSASVALILLIVFFLLFRYNRKLKASTIRLAEQGKALQELNNQKDKFFSFVVHNLSNPFTTIFGFSELLLKYAHHKEYDKMVRYGKYIYDSSEGIKHILHNLTEWTRMQKRNYNFNPSKVELESLALDTIELNSKAAAKKRVTLMYENGGGKYAFADRQMVYTILQNLISNAITFTKEEGHILITAKNIGRFVEVSVKDTGIGMDEKTLKGLFHIDISAPKNPDMRRGAGMGLILCKDLVNKNGGDIRAESSPGKGSRFTFSLPVPESEIEHVDLQGSSIEAFIKVLKKRFEKEKDLPAEFVTEMQKLLPMHQRLEKAMSVDELKEFSLTVVKLANKYDVKVFKTFGLKLYKYVDELQFDKIVRIFPEFPVLIKELQHN